MSKITERGQVMDGYRVLGAVFGALVAALMILLLVVAFIAASALWNTFGPLPTISVLIAISVGGYLGWRFS